MSGILEALKSKSGFIYTGSVSNEEIERTEKEMGVLFSNEYKEYISQYGCASFVGHEITGICSSMRLNVLYVTSQEKSLRPDLPDGMYVIEKTSIDDIVIWQDSSGAIYKTSPGKLPIKICDSLEEYLKQ
jgi:hypothetical protein